MRQSRYSALQSIARFVDKPGFTQLSMPEPCARVYVFTDPVRNPDVVGLAQTVPAKTALVYRHFGEKNRFELALNAASVCRKRKVLFFIGADPELARKCRANGVHIPEHMIRHLPRIKARFQFHQISAAAHTVRAARNALLLGADVVILSCVFYSSSPSAGKPLGLCRFALARRQIPGPVYALGGVNQENVKKLARLCDGVAVVSAIKI